MNGVQIISSILTTAQKLNVVTSIFFFSLNKETKAQSVAQLDLGSSKIQTKVHLTPMCIYSFQALILIWFYTNKLETWKSQKSSRTIYNIT